MRNPVERFPVRIDRAATAGLRERPRAVGGFSWTGMLAALVTGGLLGYTLALTMLR